MKNKNILNMILEEKTFENKMELAKLIGYEKLSMIISKEESLGTKIPHEMRDILGTLLVNEEKELAQILEKSTPEQVKVLVQAFGPEKCSEVLKFISNPAQAHLVVDYITPVRTQKSLTKKFIKVLESVLTSKEKALAQILEKSTPEQVKVLVQAFGPEKCSQTLKYISNRAQAHLVVDYITPMRCQESKSFVTKIEDVGITNYKLAQKMVMLRGLEKTEEDIQTTECFRPVKHVVADVMGPLNNENSL